MDIKEAIFSRRSIRSYLPKPISDQDIQEMLDAALWAPSAVNFQPWYFVVIKSPERRSELSQNLQSMAKKLIPILEERFEKHPNVVKETHDFVCDLGGAPVAVLVFQHKPSYPKQESTIVQSVSAAIENMILMAQGKGIGSCWLTAPLETGMGELFRDIYAPGHGPMVALLSFGYPNQSPKAPARKEGRFIIL